MVIRKDDFPQWWVHIKKSIFKKGWSNWGAFNCTYSLAAQQPEKDLPRQPLAADV